MFRKFGSTHTAMRMARRPDQWTADQVKRRLAAATDTLSIAVGANRPGGFQSSKPMTEFSFSDLVAQAAQGTVRTKPRPARLSAISDQIAMTDEAIPWPMRFLAAHADERMALHSPAQSPFQINSAELQRRGAPIR